jgi:hypothetical protein
VPSKSLPSEWRISFSVVCVCVCVCVFVCKYLALYFPYWCTGAGYTPWYLRPPEDGASAPKHVDIILKNLRAFFIFIKATNVK